MLKQNSILDWSDEEILDEARAIRVAYQLKRVIRYGAERDCEAHTESVAEHVFALFFLMEFFLPLEDPEVYSM